MQERHDMKQLQPSDNAPTGIVPRRVPGLLRFFPDQVTLYPHNATVWSATAQSHHPTRRRRQRKRQQQIDGDKEQQQGITKTTLISLLDFVGDRTIVLVVYICPGQPHSLRLLQRIVALMAAHDDILACLAVAVASQENSQDNIVMSNDESPTAATFMDDNCCCWLQGSGLGYTPLTPALQACCNVTQLPCIVVLHNGRKISRPHEELALEWNNDAASVVEQWTRGESALSLAQQVQASLLFPQCVVT